MVFSSFRVNTTNVAANAANVGASRKRKLPAGIEQIPSVSITEIKRPKVVSSNIAASSAQMPPGITSTLAAPLMGNQNRVTSVNSRQTANTGLTANKQLQSTTTGGNNPHAFQEITLVPRKVTVTTTNAATAASASAAAGGSGLVRQVQTKTKCMLV